MGTGRGGAPDQRVSSLLSRKFWSSPQQIKHVSRPSRGPAKQVCPNILQFQGFFPSRGGLDLNGTLLPREFDLDERHAHPRPQTGPRAGGEVCKVRGGAREASPGGCQGRAFPEEPDS